MHNKGNMKGESKGALDFFVDYTELTKQLFESLANAHNIIRPNEYMDRPHCYIWLDDLLLKIPDDDIKSHFMLFDKPWNWISHGEHCLFTCLDEVDKTEVEANWYNHNIVDSGFFAQFLLTYPLAQKTTFISEISYHTITNLFDNYVRTCHLVKLGGNDYIKP